MTAKGQHNILHLFSELQIKQLSLQKEQKMIVEYEKETLKELYQDGKSKIINKTDGYY